MTTTTSARTSAEPLPGAFPTADQLEALTTADLQELADREAARYGTLALFNDRRYRIGDYGPRAQALRKAKAQQHAAAHLAYVAELDRRTFSESSLDWSDTAVAPHA